MTLVEFLTARFDEDEAAASAASTDEGGRWGSWTNLPDPARVLREVAAKRAVVAAATWVGVKRASDDALGMATDSGADGQEYTLGWVLRRLATVYSDAPGYDEAWRP